MHELTIDGPGGNRLFLRVEGPKGLADTATPPAGLICVVPGFSDHSGRYPRLFAAGTAAGYRVAGFDTRGHGRSGGRRGHVESFEDFYLDVDAFLSYARRHFACGAPIFLWGHSMGALITLGYLGTGFGRGLGIAAATVCAPPFRIATPIPLWKTGLARVLSHVLPWVPFASPVRIEDLSWDLEVGRAYQQDPLVHEVASPRLYTEMRRAADALLARAPDLGLPVNFIHGEDDHLVSPEGTKAFFARVPLAEKQLRLYPGARHEVHNDPACDEAFRDAFAFFAAAREKGRAGAPASAAEHLAHAHP